MENANSIVRQIIIRTAKAAIDIVVNAMADAKRNVCREASTALQRRNGTGVAHTSPARCGFKSEVKADVSSVNVINSLMQYHQTNMCFPLSDNVVKELENFLSDIEVIEGSLKMVRSFPIVSFSFFKKLRVIQGKKQLETERYGLYVVDNQNLQSLFPHNVTIEHGKLFFHFNPKLCPAVIEELKDNVVDLRGVEKLAIEDVALNSNGDKIACNVTELTAKVTRSMSTVALIDLTPLTYEDDRSLLGYILYYMVAPYQNVTMYDGRDACGGDGWKVDDIVNIPKNSTTIPILVSHLKPYTQYAYYIKTYTIASEPLGGQTKIQYFRTQPDEPEPVRRLIVTSNGSFEIVNSR